MSLPPPPGHHEEQSAPEPESRGILPALVIAAFLAFVLGAASGLVIVGGHESSPLDIGPAMVARAQEGCRIHVVSGSLPSRAELVAAMDATELQLPPGGRIISRNIAPIDRPMPGYFGAVIIEVCA